MNDYGYQRQWFSMSNSINYVYKYNHQHKFLLLFDNDARRICDFFGVQRATAYRWIKSGQPTNATALRLLDVAASGFLPCSDAWDGYMIFNNRIITPNGYDVLPCELERLIEKDKCKATADRVINRARNFKPWRDREPPFVKDFKG